MSADEIRSAAAAAWNASLNGDWESAANHVTRVAHLDGAAARIVAAFADTTAAELKKSGQDMPDGIAWVEVEDPALSVRHADQVTPNAAWAGRVLMARWRMDEPQWLALWAAIPDGQESAYIGTALESCVLTYKGYRAARRAAS